MWHFSPTHPRKGLFTSFSACVIQQGPVIWIQVLFAPLVNVVGEVKTINAPTQHLVVKNKSLYRRMQCHQSIIPKAAADPETPRRFMMNLTKWQAYARTRDTQRGLRPATCTQKSYNTQISCATSSCTYRYIVIRPNGRQVNAMLSSVGYQVQQELIYL